MGTPAYFLLTARTVFAGRSPMKTLAAHIYEQPEPPQKHRADVPADLQDVVLRCLKKDLTARFANVESLKLALAACQAAGKWSAQEALEWWDCRREFPETGGDRTGVESKNSTSTWAQEAATHQAKPAR